VSNLESATKTIEELTEGTADWHKALQDVNSEILTLIREYPELRKYVTTDENGLMSISEEGTELAKMKALQKSQEANSAALAAEQTATMAKIDMLQNDAAETMAKSAN
jgi:hypothetical protein